MASAGPGASARKLALITGASSGIGAEFARAYAAKGYDVALVARRVDRLEALAKELSAKHNIEAIVIPADLAKWEAHLPILAQLAERNRPIHVLVNNAGFSVAESFASVPWERQRDFLMTLVVTACGLAHGVIPQMIARREGAIINVASLAGFAPGVAGHSLYPGAKALAISFSQALDAELRDKGIRVTAICPGFTATEFAEANGTKAVMDKTNRRAFQTVDQVVTAALKANDKGKVVVVPGWHNQVAAFLMHYLPQSFVRYVLRKGSAKYRIGD